MKCTEIEDGRHADMKKYMSAMTLKKNAPRKFILVSTHKFLGMRNSNKKI